MIQKHRPSHDNYYCSSTILTIIKEKNEMIKKCWKLKMIKDAEEIISSIIVSLDIMRTLGRKLKFLYYWGRSQYQLMKYTYFSFNFIDMNC